MPSRCRFSFAAAIDSSSLIDPPRLETGVRLAHVSSPFGRGWVRVRSLNRKTASLTPVWFPRPLSANVQRIPRLVFLDLESQEVMNCVQGVGTVGRDNNPRTLFRFFELVFDIALQPLHDGHAWGDLIVDQHRRFEVTSGEHPCDVAEMHSDLIT